jgi:hypothetical protein
MKFIPALIISFHSSIAAPARMKKKILGKNRSNRCCVHPSLEGQRAREADPVINAARAHLSGRMDSVGCWRAILARFSPCVLLALEEVRGVRGVSSSSGAGFVSGFVSGIAVPLAAPRPQRPSRRFTITRPTSGLDG